MTVELVIEYEGARRAALLDWRGEVVIEFVPPSGSSLEPDDTILNIGRDYGGTFKAIPPDKLRALANTMLRLADEAEIRAAKL